MCTHDVVLVWHRVLFESLGLRSHIIWKWFVAKRELLWGIVFYLYIYMYSSISALHSTHVLHKAARILHKGTFVQACNIGLGRLAYWHHVYTCLFDISSRIIGVHWQLKAVDHMAQAMIASSGRAIVKKPKHWSCPDVYRQQPYNMAFPTMCHSSCSSGSFERISCMLLSHGFPCKDSYMYWQL